MFIVFNNEEVIGEKVGFLEGVGLGGKVRLQVKELIGSKELEVVNFIVWQ